MERVIKIQSSNSISQSFRGDGSAPGPSQRLLQYRIIDDGSVYDLTQSYISITMACDTHNTAAIAGFDGVHKTMVGMLTDAAAGAFFGNSHAGDNSLLIKNLQLYSQKLGMLESIRNLNTLNLAKRSYEKDDIELQRDLDMFGVVAQTRGDHLYTTPFLDEVRITNGDGVSDAGVGANKSRFRDVEHRIYLKDIIGLGKTPLFNSSKFGDVDLSLELDLDKVRSDTISGDEENKNGTATSFLNYDDQNGIAGGAAVFTFNSTATYDDPELECPLCVGQFVSVVGTASVSGAVNVNAVVKDISYIETTKKLQVVVNVDVLVAAGGGENLVNISITPFSNPTLTIDVKGAELNLVQVKNPEQVPEEYDYITYTTEVIDGGNNATTINKSAKLEGNAQTLYIVHCKPGEIAPNNGISSYRMSIDNVDVSGNREVNYGQGIQLDRVMRAYRNKNVPLKNLEQKLTKINDEQDSMRDPLACLVEPLVLQKEEKNLQLKLTAANNVADVILFKEIVRSI